MLIIFYRAAKNSKFLVNKPGDLTKPITVALSKNNVFLLIFCKLKTYFIAKSQLLYIGCPLRESVNNVSVRLPESVRLRECVNTESDLEVKRGI